MHFLWLRKSTPNLILLKQSFIFPSIFWSIIAHTWSCTIWQVLTYVYVHGTINTIKTMNIPVTPKVSLCPFIIHPSSSFLVAQQTLITVTRDELAFSRILINGILSYALAFFGLASFTQHNYFEIHPSCLLLTCLGCFIPFSTHDGQSISRWEMWASGVPPWCLGWVSKYTLTTAGVSNACILSTQMLPVSQ